MMLETDEKIKILIVDDIPRNLVAMENVLEPLDLDIHKATSGNEALAQVLEHDFAVVLLDVQMPEMNGFETATLMRGFDDTKNVPIIFVTAISREAHYVFKGYESGAVDYMSKPFKPEILTSKVSIFCELYRQRKILKDMNQQLKAHNDRLEEELQMAREIQRILIPLNITGYAGFQIFSHYTPESTVGGDFFDLWEIEQGRLGIFISDVMGHGVSAAFVTVFIKTVIEQTRRQTDDPGQLLETLNARFDRLISSQLFMFATAFCAVLELSKGAVRYANAGHPYPFLLRRDSGVCNPIGTQEPGAGVGLISDSTYQTFESPFAPTDGLLLFTDGAYELQNSQREEFSVQRIQEVIAGQVTQPAEVLVESVIHAIDQFRGDVPLEDDITIVAIDAEVGEHP
jgi:phosphoserine phosphatase RsbU/P